MPAPEVNSTGMAVLAALSDGRPATTLDLRDRLAWETDKFRRFNLPQRLRMLRARGLVERVSVTLAADDRTEEESAHRITGDGRRAWEEARDFYLFMIDRFTPKPGDPPPAGPAVLGVRPAGEPSRPPRDRRATPEELDRVAPLVPPATAAAFRVTAAGLIHPDRLGRLLVGDAAADGSAIEVDGCTLPVPPELRPAVVAAVGGRAAGPLFPRPGGRTWNLDSITGAFRRVRGKAGLPADRVIVGRRRTSHGPSFRAE